ncbi:Caspase domain protein [compost metagenome]
MPSNNYIFAIGIDDYSSPLWKSLNNAVLDAETLTEILKKRYSFEAFPDNLYNSNATKSEIFNSLNSLNQIVSEEDSLIIFFAGHGNMDPATKKGFLIPTDGTLDRSTWIENSSIKNFISDCPAKHILLIIDSCFSGTFLTTTRNGNLERTYLDLNSKKSRWVISSGGEEKVSDGLPNEHSPFGKKIFDFLNKNDNESSSVSELFNYIQLLISSRNNQKPQCNYIDGVGHNDGELVFTISDSIKSKVTKTIGIPNSEILRQEFLANISTDNRLASGKEILIVKSIVDDYDFMIIENFRFNDENEKKIKFIDNIGILDLNNIENSWDVIRRFATVEGMINYIQKYPEFNGEKTIFLGAHPDIGYVEEQLYSIYYSQYLTQLLNSNRDQMQCLHCGEKITDNDNYLIEFDDYGYSTAVGNVHNNCLRPIDRILGKSIYKDILQDHYLKNFDFDKWIQLLQDGQGQLAFLKKHKNLPDINIISWNPANHLNNGSYCIKIIFDNGDTNYVMVGKQIQRFTEKEIDSWIQRFTDALTSKPCKIIQSGINGYIDTIQNIIEEGQTISYVHSYEKVRYSKLLEKTETIIINDYTPLCYFTNSNDELLEINDMIPFISDPQSVEDYINNWQSTDDIDENYKIKIVESDLELANIISVYYQQNKTIVINPIFDVDIRQLKKGAIIKPINQIIK